MNEYTAGKLLGHRVEVAVGGALIKGEVGPMLGTSPPRLKVGDWTVVLKSIDAWRVLEG